MKQLSIYLADGTFDGDITMSSPNSKFVAIRVARENLESVRSDLEFSGVYMLLIGSDTVYVGQTGLDYICNRACSTHSGNIDASWHTLLAFCCEDRHISANELLFLENVLCEYAHSNYPNCISTNPSKTTCNKRFRETQNHYLLGSRQILTCNRHISDIKFFISRFANTIFPSQSAVPVATLEPAVEEISLPSNDEPIDIDANVAASAVETHFERELFYFSNPSRGVQGCAEIIIHCGHTKKRQAILKKGAKLSPDILTFREARAVRQKRNRLISEGKIVDGILQVDLPFPSQSAAGSFLNGTSFDGNKNWKTSSGIPLKTLLE